MLNPKTINSSTCASIATLIEEIDCKLAKLSGNLYNNIIFMLNRPVQASVIIDLLMYKRILQYKNINVDYAGCYTVAQIASKIKTLKYK